jgi:hypothetical protein
MAVKKKETLPEVDALSSKKTHKDKPVKAPPKPKKKSVKEEKVEGMFDALKAKIQKANKGIHCEVMSESTIAKVEN